MFNSYPRAGNICVACSRRLPSLSLSHSLAILFFIFLFQPVLVQASAKIANGPCDVQTQLPDGGFENPVVTTIQGYEYNPTGGAWTFHGSSGLSKNNTGFTWQNPPAPDSAQVCFLQGVGWAEQNVDLQQGYYQLRIKAAQRGSVNPAQQTFRIEVAGNVIMTITPPDTLYTQFVTPTFFLPSGLQNVRLVGTNPAGGDNTALVDDFTVERVCTVPVPGGPCSVSGPFSTHPRLLASPNPSLIAVQLGVKNVNLTIDGAGIYRLRFEAKLNGTTGLQRLQVSVDGEEVGEFDVTSNVYSEYITLALYLGAGAHTIKFKALESGNKATFRNIRLESIPDWNDPWIWDCIAVPTVNDSAIIPVDVSVGMMQSPVARAVVVNGELLAVQNRTFSISAKTILIMGNTALLEIGRSTTPYYLDGVITLTGVVSDTLSMFPMGSKFLGGMVGATLEVHGAEKMGWTRLGMQADSGDVSITLSEPVDWEVGDSIVIATTDYDPHQSEVRTITAISNNKKTLTLNSTLSYMHYGKIDTFTSPYREHYLDQRAEVGVLTRNLRIEGDLASATSYYGGHVMIMSSSKAYFSGVEFLRCGQEGLLGRYPFHWHHDLDVTGQYIEHSSIHRSYNRVVTVHNSQNARVEGNVGYDHLGHGYFLEAGSETGCLFKDNLGILTRLPDSLKAVEPHDFVREHGLVLLPATYWITNPGNDYIGNVAAGSEGSGFWQVNLPAPLEGTTPQPPLETPMGIFKDNSAHSTSFSNYSIDGGINPMTHEFTTGHYRPQTSGGAQFIPVIENFTAYRSLSRSLWMRANTMRFENCVSADSRLLTLFAFNHIYHNSLLVGHSPNIGNPKSAEELAAGRSLPAPSLPASNISNRVDGYPVYDGPAEFRKTHFAGFTGGNAFCIRPNGAATKSTVHRVDSLTFDAGIAAADKVDFDYSSFIDHQWSSGVIDIGGSLTDTAGIRITPNIRFPYSSALPYLIFDSLFNVEPGAYYRADWNAWYTRKKYALYRLDNKWPAETFDPIYMIRSDDHAVLDALPAFDKFQTSVIVNDTFQYRWQYHRLANRVDSWFRFADNGDEIVGIFDNVASSTLALDASNNPIPQATSLNDLMTSNVQKYWLQDNTLYLKHVAANGGVDWQFGNLYSAKSPKIRVCQNANCADPTGRTNYMTLADFEWGADSRTSLSGTIPTGPIAYDVGATPFDATNNKVTWTVNGDADGNDEYVDLRIDFPRQVWTGFKTIRIYWTGDSVNVRLHDKSQVDTDLGIYAPDTTYIDIQVAGTNQYYQYFDEVVGITLRVQERFLGSLSSNTSQQYSLYDILLYDTIATTGMRIAGMEEDYPEIIPADEFELFPNPTEGIFTLEKQIYEEDLVMVAMYDITGKLVYENSEVVHPGLWSSRIDTRNAGLAPGVYHVMIGTVKHGRTAKKLVISR